MNKTITTFSHLLLLLISACSPAIYNEPDQPIAPKEINILAIGNSFTEDVTTYIPHLLQEKADTNINFYRLVKGGASLEEVWKNHEDNNNIFSLEYADNGLWKQIDEIKNINKAIIEKKWDIITIQQVSGLSGLPESYHPYLENILSFLKQSNDSLTIAFHKTWAYAENSSHPDFKRYQNNQDDMYQKITHAVDSIKENFNIIIRSGDLIRHLRKRNLKYSQNLTRDGYHLDRSIPAYACGLLWYKILISPLNKKEIFPLKNISIFSNNPDLPIVENSIKEVLKE